MKILYPRIAVSRWLPTIFYRFLIKCLFKIFIQFILRLLGQIALFGRANGIMRADMTALARVITDTKFSRTGIKLILGVSGG